MFKVKYEVWGTNIILNKSFLIAVFEEDKWQMAQKLLNFLERHNYREVFIKSVSEKEV